MITDHDLTPTHPPRSGPRLPQQRGLLTPDGTAPCRPPLTALPPLAPRERWLAECLASHQVLTGEQIAEVAFSDHRTARQHLNRLAIRAVLARFPHTTAPSCRSWLWTLGWAGAAQIAAANGQQPPDPAAVTARIARLAAAPHLEHLLAVNGFFTSLTAYGRHHPGAFLESWWPRRRCVHATGGLVHPDGRGEWTEDGGTVRFWLHWHSSPAGAARNIETALDGYSTLAGSAGTPDPVLFRVHTARQERAIQTRLAHHPAVASGQITTATSFGTHTLLPAAEVWQPTGTRSRVRLAHIGPPNP